jgi:hypothetical protein
VRDFLSAFEYVKKVFVGILHGPRRISNNDGQVSTFSVAFTIDGEFYEYILKVSNNGSPIEEQVIEIGNDYEESIYHEVFDDDHPHLGDTTNEAMDKVRRWFESTSVARDGKGIDKPHRDDNRPAVHFAHLPFNLEHPMVGESFVGKYLSWYEPDNREQLILSTFDDNFINPDELRIDEIWIMDETRNEGSNLICLSDYKDIKADSDIRRSYRQGRFGGLPKLLYGGFD